VPAPATTTVTTMSAPLQNFLSTSIPIPRQILP
jgi:hypothetical protein